MPREAHLLSLDLSMVFISQARLGRKVRVELAA
jgi:hypothetical protein